MNSILGQKNVSFNPQGWFSYIRFRRFSWEFIYRNFLKIWKLNPNLIAVRQIYTFSLFSYIVNHYTFSPSKSQDIFVK